MSEHSGFQKRYHIYFKNRRTTITLDNIVSDLLAYSLGIEPDHEDCHSTIRQWLQETLTEKLGENVPGGNYISQHARQYTIEAIANPKLMEKVVSYRLKNGY